MEHVADARGGDGTPRLVADRSARVKRITWLPSVLCLQETAALESESATSALGHLLSHRQRARQVDRLQKSFRRCVRLAEKRPTDNLHLATKSRHGRGKNQNVM